MESIRKVAKRIVELSPGAVDKETCINAVRMNIYYLIDDVLQIVKNINETSLPGKDRTERIIELEKKYGIPKTHLL
jgi:hypothetical protein